MSPGRHVEIETVTTDQTEVPSEAGATPSLPENTVRAAVPQVARGFVLGTVDLVPGVSGGTAALVLGIYRQLIASIHHTATTVTRLVRGDFTGFRAGARRIPLLWLGGLGVGIVTVILLLSGPLERSLEALPVPLAGLFSGLITAAIILCWRQLQQVKPLTWVLVAIAAVGTFFGLGLAPTNDGTGPAPALWVFFLSGAIAICAMILPGISGAFILVLLGMYPHVIGAVADREWSTMAVFALGCAVGLALSGSALNWLLTHYHDVVLALMIGLMVGSLRVLWPWPNGLGNPEMAWPTATTALLPIVLGVGGFALVMSAEAIAKRVRRDDQLA